MGECVLLSAIFPGKAVFVLTLCISFAVEGLLQAAPEPLEHLEEVTEDASDQRSASGARGGRTLTTAVLQLEKKCPEVWGGCGKDYITRDSHTGTQRAHPVVLEIQNGCFSPHRLHLKFNLATQT